MSYTFLDQQNKLSSLLGDDQVGTTDQFPTAVRQTELNRGELQFAKDALYLMEYATGTIASAQIAIPADWLETFSLIVNNYIINPDREISVQDWERFYNYAGNSPYFYYWRFSGTRYIKFIGSSINGLTYNLYYFKRPTVVLAGDTDVSIHDEEYREASCYYAACQLMSQIGKTQMSDRYMAFYKNLVREVQMQSEKHYLKKQYAHPDVNAAGGLNEQDREGGGW